MALLFFVDLLHILNFVLSELCHKYIMNFIFVTLIFLADNLDVVELVERCVAF